MVLNRLAGALGAPSQSVKPDGRMRPILISKSRAHSRKKLGLAWAGACASLRRRLDGLSLALGLSSMHDQCPPTPQSGSQSDSRGILRQRDDEHHGEGPLPQRTRRDELSEVPLEDFAAKAAALALMDDGDDAEEQAALARAAAAAAVPATKYTAEEGDSMETKLLYVTTKQKGMITKEDIMLSRGDEGKTHSESLGLG